MPFPGKVYIFPATIFYVVENYGKFLDVFFIGSFELLAVKWPAYFTFPKLCYWFWNDLYLGK